MSLYLQYCVKCGTLLAEIPCGVPCSFCRYRYPLGDCSER